MKNELCSMVDFVLAQPSEIQNRITSFESIHHYAVFLEEPLNISQFVPAIKVRDKWEVLELPKRLDQNDPYIEAVHARANLKLWQQYQTAKDNVIFEGFKLDGKFISHDQVSYLIDRLHYNTIQDLIKYKPTLTKKGLEVSGLNR